MSIRVFDTYHASDEEIEGIKHALNEANIRFYETHKGKWGIGSAAIWIEREHEYQIARQAIEDFEQEWKRTIQKESATQKVNWHAIPIAVFVTAIVLYLNFSWLY